MADPLFFPWKLTLTEGIDVGNVKWRAPACLSAAIGLPMSIHVEADLPGTIVRLLSVCLGF